MYRPDQSAYLCGIATCQYLQDNYDEYKSNGLNVGTFGGTSIPTVTIYMGGLERGVYDYNTYILPTYLTEELNLTAGSIEYNEALEARTVNFIDLGVLDSFFSGSFVIGDGKLCVQNLLQMGADAIMPVAGPQTIDTVQEIVNQKSSCIVIGVDTPQEDSYMNEKSIYTDTQGNDSVIKFSAVKDISGITSQIIDLASHGYLGAVKNDSGEYTFIESPEALADYVSTTDQKTITESTFIGSYGTTTVGNLANGAAAISDDGVFYVDEAFYYASKGNQLGNIAFVDPNLSSDLET